MGMAKVTVAAIRELAKAGQEVTAGMSFSLTPTTRPEYLNKGKLLL